MGRADGFYDAVRETRLVDTWQVREDEVRWLGQSRGAG